MSNTNREVSENTENINGIVVVTKVTDNGTRFYTKGADGGLSQLAKAKYFTMLEEQSEKEVETAKTVRAVNAEYRAMSYTEMTRTERSKVEWFQWNQENRSAKDKADKILSLMDEVHVIPDYIDEEEDVVSVGGWLYRKDATVGFISNHLKSKGNLDMTLYEDGNMPHWEQSKRSYVVSKMKYIDGLLNAVGTALVSDYYVTPELTDEQQLEVAIGNKTEFDYSNQVHVHLLEILGIDVLVHIMFEYDKDVGATERIYFVEELPSEESSDEPNTSTEEL